MICSEFAVGDAMRKGRLVAVPRLILYISSATTHTFSHKHIHSSDHMAARSRALEAPMIFPLAYAHNHTLFTRHTPHSFSHPLSHRASSGTWETFKLL